MRQHLEALSGESLGALLRRLVFDPLQIAGPRVALTRGDLDGVALGVMTGSGPKDSRVIGHSGGRPGSLIAVYHHPDAAPPFTAAAFSSGEDIGRVEAKAMALRS